MTTPTAIHLTTGEVLHVVDDDCIINEETGAAVAVVTAESDPVPRVDFGALIPRDAISYYELPAGQVRVVLEVARAEAAGAHARRMGGPQS